MANSPQEEGGQAQAKPKLSLVVFSPEVVQDLKISDPFYFQIQTIAKNHDNLALCEWVGHYIRQDGYARGIKDEKGTLYLVLFEGEGNERKIVGHCKIVPPGVETVTASIAEDSFKKSAQQLIDPQTAMSVLAIHSGNHENEEHITETEGVYGINSSKLRGGELIQFFGGPREGFIFLLFCYLMTTFPKDRIEELKMPTFQMVGQNPERAQAIKEAEEHIKTFFRDTDFFLTTTWADGMPPLFKKVLNEAFELCFSHIPDGLTTYLDKMIQEENPYKKKAPPIRPDFFLKYQQYKSEISKHHNDPVAFVLLIMSRMNINEINAMNKQGQYEILDPVLSSKWEKHTTKLWKAIFSAWQTHMNKAENRRDPKKAHKAFITEVSEQLNGFSEVAKANGLIIPIGPQVPDFDPDDPNFDPTHPKQFRSIRTALLPPLPVEIPDFFEYPYESYNLGAVTWTDMCRDIEKQFGIDVSEISFLNANLKTLLPEGYLKEFHQAQMKEATEIKNHLSKHAPVQKGSKTNPVTTSPYRSPLPPPHMYDYNKHAIELFKRIQQMRGSDNDR